MHTLYWPSLIRVKTNGICMMHESMMLSEIKIVARNKTSALFLFYFLFKVESSNRNSFIVDFSEWPVKFASRISRKMEPNDAKFRHQTW